MGRKIKVKLNPLTTQAEIDQMLAYASDTIGFNVNIANVETDYKGKNVKVELMFPKDTDKDLMKDTKSLIQSLIGVDGTIVYPMGGSLNDMDALVVGTVYPSIELVGPSNLTVDLTPGFQGANQSCEFKGNANGQAGNALGVMDLYNSADATYAGGGGTISDHVYQGQLVLQQSGVLINHVKYNFDLKLDSDGELANWPAPGGTLLVDLNLITSGVDITRFRIAYYDNIDAILQITTGGVDTFVQAPLDLTSGYVNVDIEFLGEISASITAGALNVSVPVAHTNVNSNSLNIIKQDKWLNDAAAKTQNTTLIDNLLVEILS